MQLFDTTQLALERTVAGAAQRHTALAANLANANTPGYQRVDVDFHSALQTAIAVESRPLLEHASFTPQADPSAQTRADGSSVDVDLESARMAQNGLEHQAAVQIAGTRISILEYAMGVR